MLTEIIYLILIAVIAVIAAAVFAKRGQTDMIRKLISELYNDIDSDELSEKFSKLTKENKKR